MSEMEICIWEEKIKL